MTVSSARMIHFLFLSTVKPEPMARVRTFIAIDISEEIREAAQRVIRALEPLASGARWVRPENMHCTLKFLGEVDERELPDVCHHITDAVKKRNKFEAQCVSVGAFPQPSKPSTIWLGLRDGNDELLQLRDHLEENMSALGFPREQRRFQGHITLGRLRKPLAHANQIHAFLRDQEHGEFGNLPIDEVVLYRSDLSRHGPEYTRISRFALR